VINAVKNNEEIIAVQDMISSPTYSLDLAELINSLIPLNECGTFHASNKGYCSRVEMVEEIMKVMRKNGNIKVVNQSQWKREAKRPVFSALMNYHLGLIDKDIMAGWRDALRRYVRFKFGS
jgi:dTDP-4-dehydrorhamnose reductase